MLFDVLTMMEGAALTCCDAQLWKDFWAQCMRAQVPPPKKKTQKKTPPLLLPPSQPCHTRMSACCASARAHGQVEEEGELLLFDVLIMHVRG